MSREEIAVSGLKEKVEGLILDRRDKMVLWRLG
jgi:hypothetical protein